MIPTPKSMKLVLAGGGTGGHFFPAVAIANRIGQMMAGIEPEITFVGTQRGIEYRMRDQLGYPLRLINIRGLARSFTLQNLLVPFLVIGSLWRSRSLLKELEPDLVIGTGGYVSWPVLRMARAMGIPTVLQEQNSYPGIVTRKLAHGAKRVYLGFEAARHHLESANGIMVTGNPVRKDIADSSRDEALAYFGLDDERKTILVLGGSQGARSINQAVVKSLKERAWEDQYQLLWQTGKLDFDTLTSELGERGSHHFAFAFENQMSLVYAAADLVIARAGAISIAELEACRKPALLIPYPFAAGDHQRHNARAYAGAGLAEVIEPEDLEKVDLLKRAVDLLRDGTADKMIAAIGQKAAGRKPAVDVIAEDIIRLVAGTQEATVDR